MEQTFYLAMGWHGANLLNQIGIQKDHEHNAPLYKETWSVSDATPAGRAGR